MIYLAGPYYHNDPTIIQARMEIMYEILAYFMKREIYCSSPMLMHAVVKRHNLPNNFEYWDKYSYNLLKGAEGMFVMTLEGWETSRGVRKEIEFCIKNKIPVFFLDIEKILVKSLPIRSDSN